MRDTKYRCFAALIVNSSLFLYFATICHSVDLVSISLSNIKYHYKNFRIADFVDEPATDATRFNL